MDVLEVVQQLDDAQDSSSSSEGEQLTLQPSKELFRDAGSDSDNRPSMMDDSDVTRSLSKLLYISLGIGGTRLGKGGTRTRKRWDKGLEKVGQGLGKGGTRARIGKDKGWEREGQG